MWETVRGEWREAGRQGNRCEVRDSHAEDGKINAGRTNMEQQRHSDMGSGMGRCGDRRKAVRWRQKVSECGGEIR